MTVRALAIAVENYPRGSSVAGLKGVVDGARLFLDTLVENCKLNPKDCVFCSSADVRGKTHGTTKKEIRSALEQLLLGRDDTKQLFVYIAGHGVSTSVPGWASSDLTDLLLCSNFKSANSSSAVISIDELLTQLARGLGAGDHYAFIDLCRNQADIQPSTLGMKAALAMTGVANHMRLSSARPGDAASNDREFLNVLLTALQGEGSAETIDNDSHHHWVTFQTLRHDVEERLASLQRSCEVRIIGSGNSQILCVPPGREVKTIRQRDELKVPPVKLLTYYDEVIFLGETNSQLAGVARDKAWQPIVGQLNFLQQALADRRGRPWKRLEVYMLERLETAGRPSQSLAQLVQERTEAETFLKTHAAELADELRVYRYEYPGFYGSIWLSETGKRHVHMSQRVTGQNIRLASANDFIDFPGDRLSQVEHCLGTLAAVRSAKTTKCILEVTAGRVRVDLGLTVASTSAAKSSFVSSDTPSGTAARGGIHQNQFASGVTTSADPLSLTSLADRASRSLQLNSISDLVDRKRAIIGPKDIDQMTEEAEQARQLLLKKVKPSPLQMAALEQAIRLQRPAPACVRDGLTQLPVEGNWIANLWLHFQPTLRQLQTSVARLDRIDGTGQQQVRNPMGTGFLVAEDLMVTAAHVVTQMSFGTGVLQAGQSEAEFEGYLGEPGKSVCPVVEVVKYDPVIDLALLRLAKCAAKPIMLDKVSRPVPSFPVCVVGYPMDDPNASAELVSLIFGGKFGVKRAAIGEVLVNDGHRFSHDCSTLGGASGGPVFDLNTGQLCGVHVAGLSFVRNEAVDAQCLLDFIKPIQNPTPVGLPVSVSPNFPLPPIVYQERSTMPSKNASRFLDELKEMDPEAFGEVKQQQESMRSENAGGQPQLSEETIVLLKGRPVLDVKAGAAVLDITEIESQVWKNRLQSSLSMLKGHVPSVGRIELLNNVGGGPFIGTGWVLRDDIIVTNRHVARLFAERNGERFAFVPGFDGTPVRAMVDFLEEFGSAASAEFPVFEVVHIEDSSGPDLAFLRIKPMSGQSLPKAVATDSSTAAIGDQVAVIGYPARDPFFPQPAEMDRIFNSRYDKKRLAPGLVKKSTSTEFLHDCSTLGGNSGSEIVSLKSGKAVALHFAGTLFTSNHAVPIQIVNERLDKILRTPPSKPATAPGKKENSNVNSVEVSSPSRVIEATIPIRIRVELGDLSNVDVSVPAPASADDAGTSMTVTGNTMPTRPGPSQDDMVEVTEARPEEYRNRRGYDARFLGDDFEVPLPKFTANQEDILEFKVGEKRMTELRYTHFSVVMSRSRRMCRFSACNIDGQQSKKTTRAAWRMDPRIADAAQILKECYGNEPKFSRGHMTRREDPAWGSKDTANLGNTDSMHVTNTVPQMQPFNAGVWLELEDYALQNAREDDMRICVITGPFLAANDPILFDVKIPITFWKVIAFIHDETGELCATGYTMSQKSFLPNDRNEFVFGKHENNQRSIASIGARAGLDFGILAEVDPLRHEPESVEKSLNRLSDIQFL